MPLRRRTRREAVADCAVKTRRQQVEHELTPIRGVALGRQHALERRLGSMNRRIQTTHSDSDRRDASARLPHAPAGRDGARAAVEGALAIARNARAIRGSMRSIGRETAGAFEVKAIATIPPRGARRVLPCCSSGARRAGWRDANGLETWGRAMSQPRRPPRSPVARPRPTSGARCRHADVVDRKRPSPGRLPPSPTRSRASQRTATTHPRVRQHVDTPPEWTAPIACSRRQCASARTPAWPGIAA